MSYAEILGPNGQILPRYIPDEIPLVNLSKGDLITANQAGEYVDLNVGIDGTVLQADSSQPFGLKWAVIPGAVPLQQGELITADAQGFTRIVQLGANGQYLRANRLDPNGEGLTWTNIGDSITANFPLKTANDPATLNEVVSFSFTANTKGQIPAGVSDATGSVGALVNLGTANQVLSVSANPSNATGLEWRDNVFALTKGNNITLSGTTDRTISLSSPLDATLAMGTQSITGSSGTITLSTTGAGGQTASMAANVVKVNDTTTTTTLSQISSTGILSGSSGDGLLMTPTALTKSTGATAFTIAHNISAGPINLTTLNGAADVTTNCPFAPKQIKDKDGLVGNAKYLTCNASGLLVWANGVSDVATGAGSNIVVNETFNVDGLKIETVALANPLNAGLNLGTQTVSGSTANITLTDSTVGVVSRSVQQATAITVQDSVTTTTRSNMNKAGVSAQTATDTTTMTPAGLSKSAGGALTIANSVAGQVININTTGGADVVSNAVIKPAGIRDPVNSLTGQNGQVITANGTGGFTWAAVPTPLGLTTFNADLAGWSMFFNQNSYILDNQITGLNITPGTWLILIQIYLIGQSDNFGGNTPGCGLIPRFLTATGVLTEGRPFGTPTEDATFLGKSSGDATTQAKAYAPHYNELITFGTTITNFGFEIGPGQIKFSQNTTATVTGRVQGIKFA